MWNNIGRKVQRLAKVLCWLGILLSVLVGVLCITGSQIIMGGNMNVISDNATARVIVGVIIMVIGFLASWISAWVTYAIGEAAEAAEKNR